MTDCETQSLLDVRPAAPRAQPGMDTDWKRRVPSVSILTRQLRGHLENSFFDVWVRGEISNFRKPVSGHGYFVLKDAQSQLRSVMFRNALSKLRFDLEDGMDVIAHGSISIYEARGEYQIICDHVEPLGLGALQMAFEKLKAKLQAEGLFHEKHKKPLPALPRKIGIVTSPTGAAIRDILTVLYRRFPNRETLLIPAAVQGEKAAGEIVQAIQRAEQWNQEHPESPIDVLIVGRGGGSLEDLWPFNEEAVARAIFDCPIPIISAVGHEIDFTISDFVADVRAPTPSAAAEIVVPEYQALVQLVREQERCLVRSLRKQIEQMRLHVGHISKRILDPRQKLQQQRRQLEALEQRLVARMKSEFRLIRQRFESLTALLHQLSPLQVVARGFSITQDSQGRLVRRLSDAAQGQEITTRVSDGVVHSRVTQCITLSQPPSTTIESHGGKDDSVPPSIPH